MTMRGFDAAQRAYDNMTPDDSTPLHECTFCNGSGVSTDSDMEDEECKECTGFGWLLDGEPYDKHAAEIAAEQAAERPRDD